jgi:hypothetical protein
MIHVQPLKQQSNEWKLGLRNECMANLTNSELLLLTFLNNVVDLTSPGVGLGGDPPVALLLKLLLRILPALLLLLIIFGLLPSCFFSFFFPERKILNYALTTPGYK